MLLPSDSLGPTNEDVQRLVMQQLTHFSIAS